MIPTVPIPLRSTTVIQLWSLTIRPASKIDLGQVARLVSQMDPMLVVVGNES